MRLWKRYTWLGGTRTPLIVHWPRGIDRPGAVRSQLAHAIDLAPTILDAIGLEPPASVDGVPQQRIDGASLLETFRDPSAPSPRTTQYFEMLGSRSIIHEGWKATTNHISVGVLDEEELAVGSRSFAEDDWELFDLGADFSESNDLAAAHPERVAALAERWRAEAEANQALPIDDTLLNRIGALIPPAWPAGDRLVLRPGGGPVIDESLPFLFGGFRLSAEVDLPATGADGVLAALGDWNGGFALFLADGRLHFALSIAGLATEVAAEEVLPVGPAVLGVSYDVIGSRLELLQDGAVVGAVALEGFLPPALQHGGAALRLGHDAGFPVSRRYSVPGRFTGLLARVLIETPGALQPGVGEELRAALHSD
jgi:arylsulfatase